MYWTGFFLLMILFAFNSFAVGMDRVMKDIPISSNTENQASQPGTEKKEQYPANLSPVSDKYLTMPRENNQTNSDELLDIRNSIELELKDLENQKRIKKKSESQERSKKQKGIEKQKKYDNQSEKSNKSTRVETPVNTAPIQKNKYLRKNESYSLVDNNIVKKSHVTEDVLFPEYVIPLMNSKRGYNNSNPIWNLSGTMMGFERSNNHKKEIIITNLGGKIIKSVYYKEASDNDFAILLPGIIEDISYNAGMTWSSSGDRFVFMSNAGEGNYDLYLGSFSAETRRLTVHQEKDGQPHWSPVGDKIVFVSSRTGKAEIFLMDVVTGKIKQITNGRQTFLHPKWSPDGRHISLTFGQNENHDIMVINRLGENNEHKRRLTNWKFDDLKPTWSPDGKKIAFYSNYNEELNPNKWAIVVLPSTNDDPLSFEQMKTKVTALNVIPDIEKGPAWMPDSKYIVYVRNNRQSFYPIYMVNTENKQQTQIVTNTKINHDLSASKDGVIAFRAQVDQWDQIFVTKLKASFFRPLKREQ